MIIMDIAWWIADILVLGIAVLIWAIAIFFIILIMGSMKDMAERIVTYITERKQERK